MENASKALIMAGSVLIALMIIGALILMFNSLSSYQKTSTQDTREEQVIEFNKQFETYERDDIRGSDMISLMNRVIDYNTRKTDTSDEKYEKMQIDIYGIDVTQLLYNEKDEKLFKTSSYNQDTISDFLNPVKELETKYQSKYITTLSSNIAKIMDTQKGEDEMKKLVPTNIQSFGIDQIRKDTAKYYQYTQFKRVYFDCEIDKTKYNSGTGRITYMSFKCKNVFQ